MYHIIVIHTEFVRQLTFETRAAAEAVKILIEKAAFKAVIIEEQEIASPK